MFRLTKKVLITLSSFSRSIATKCISLNNEIWLATPVLIDLNSNELHYCPFMVSVSNWSVMERKL